MKHPSRWPYILRMPVCMALVCLAWWGPLILGFLAIKRWGFPPEFTEGERTAFTVIPFLGWSLLIMRTLVFRVIEPYFNTPSLQNPFKHLFRPEPVFFSSFREWFDWMFRGVKDEPAQSGLSERGQRQAARRARR